ncbi:MAG: YiiX/YebB-like N1pC/P60 family cysteine hydrolase [Motiliproteus sp.]|nr:YiiX/YebB-like N1pC/P60 family cysteine hydrolase [Motiliproteus sp.]MCW9053692.1 YiiX/YebB-like N1pC/P60 family cysteine hydrolase [Motiliproteus sp.]
MNQQQLDTLHSELVSQLRNGDILFISINAFLYKQVAKGTGSWCSHVGFAIEENGHWYVLESKVPRVKKTPLRDFIGRTCNGEVAVRRLKKELTQDQIKGLQTAAEERMGQWYHLGFNYDSPRQYCSKFVHQVYKQALGVKLGELQTLEVLLEENPQANVTFWRVWYFGMIPWQRRTVTPASQLVDPQLETIFSTV